MRLLALALFALLPACAVDDKRLPDPDDENVPEVDGDPSDDDDGVDPTPAPDPDDDDDAAEPPPTTLELLATSPRFAVAAAESTVAIDLDGAAVPLGLTDGTVGVSVDHDGQLILDDAALVFAPSTMPTDEGTGTILDASVRFGGAIRCDQTTWSDDDQSAACLGKALLVLDWRLNLGEHDWPLGTQYIDGVDVGLVVVREEGRLRLDVTGEVIGIEWHWGPKLVTVGLTFTVRAYLAVATEQP